MPQGHVARSKLALCARCPRNLTNYRHVARNLKNLQTSRLERRNIFERTPQALKPRAVSPLDEGLEIMFVIYILPELQMTPTDFAGMRHLRTL